MICLLLSIFAISFRLTCLFHSFDDIFFRSLSLSLSPFIVLIALNVFLAFHFLSCFFSVCSSTPPILFGLDDARLIPHCSPFFLPHFSVYKISNLWLLLRLNYFDVPFTVFSLSFFLF